MKKRIMAALLAGALMLSLTACITKPESSAGKTTGESSGEAQPAESSTAEENIDPIGKYAEPVVLTSVRGINADYKFPEGKSMEDNAMLDYVKEKLNVEVKYDWIVDTTQLQNKVSTMLASNTMPDFFNADPATFTNLANEQAILDITEIYKKYEGDLLKKEVAAFEIGQESAFVDGKMYGIPLLGFGTIALPNIVWVRQDWLDKSGLAVPKTVDELQQLALKFMEQNEGSYGLAVDKSLTSTSMHSVVPIMNGYGASSKVWVKKDGQIVYGSIQPEMKEALLKLQEMYSQGIINKEFSVKDTDKVNEDIASGKVGIVGGAQWIGVWPLNLTVENNPQADWTPIAVPTKDGEPGTLQGPWPVDGYWVVNQNCKNPEAVVKLVNLYLQADADGDMDKWQNEMGMNWTTFPCYQTAPARDYDKHVAIVEAFESKDSSKLDSKALAQYDSMMKWVNDKDVSGFGNFKQSGPGGAYAVIKDYVDTDRIMITELRGADPAGYANVKATLEKLEDDTFTKIIMGEDIKSFDEFVSTWNKLGGEAATKEVNDTYNQ